MNHIEYAVCILKNDIENKKDLLERGHLLPETEEMIMENLQMLHRAISDIQKLINDWVIKKEKIKWAKQCIIREF